MALARDRTHQNLQFDPSSLDFFGAACIDPQDSQSVVDFKAATADHWTYSKYAPSVFSFEQGGECVTWIGNMNPESHPYRQGEDRFGLLYPTVSDTADCLEGSCQRRTYMGDEMQATKKQCCNNRKVKVKPTPAIAKDPQSIAAKNRREKISERLKVLQELVPNGTKVDLVTMLEKAISYVKFLQLQVKVLATDEFWPAQGSAPEVAQVKEAIDAILSSQRGSSSSSMQSYQRKKA